MNERDKIKNAIEANNLSKKYGKLLAVDSISFKVKEGEIFGFLGPNGAGKTTTINMIIGLSKITAGKVKVNGQTRVEKIQESIGVVGSESNLYPELSGFDNLCFAASLYGMRKEKRQKRAGQLLTEFGLADAADRLFGAYSKGMKRKLTIAAGIIHKPKILFLDEPTTGIDVGSARQIRRLIADLNREGTTIFLTTHYIEEAERLCDRVAFLVEGKIRHIDKTENLLNQAHQEKIIEFLIDKDCLKNKNTLLEKLSDYEVELTKSKIRIHVEERTEINKFIDLFNQSNCNVYEAKLIRPSLEDVFVKITGLDIEEMKNNKEKGGK